MFAPALLSFMMRPFLHPRACGMLQLSGERWHLDLAVYAHGQLHSLL